MDEFIPKAAVSKSEMARMVGLSRTRFRQLVDQGVFSQPVHDIRTKRPFYTEELQRACLEVRRKNCGINGQAVLFYARRGSVSTSAPKKRTTTKKSTTNKHTDLIDGLTALGLPSVTTAQVDQSLRELFPAGTADVPQEEVLRAVFVHLKRQDSSGNQGR